MTREEAIRLIGWLKCTTNREDDLEALDMAIEALQAKAVQEAVPTVVRVTMSDGSQYYLEHERDAIQADAVIRDATAEERASVQRYIDSISTEAVQGEECDHCVYKWGMKGGDSE